MSFQVPLPPNISDQAMIVWQQVGESLTLGDIQGLQQAIQGFISLSATDKQMLEDMAAMLPYPGLPPLLITEIFSNPEASIGVIDRLDTGTSNDQLIQQLGTAEQAIVLDALITWVKTEENIAATSQSDAKNRDAKSSSVHLLNQALQNYISSGGQVKSPLNMGALQFLKNNTVTLAGLKIADPALLNQAYNIASQQLLLGLLPAITNTDTQTTPTQSSEQARSNLIQQELVSAIKKALQEGAIPLNMQTFLVLWTAITLPTMQQNQPNWQTPATTTPRTGVEGAPSNPIVTSLTASLPSLFVGQDFQPTATLTEQLGLLSFIYTQMAPYWSGPAAVSLMTVQGGEVTQATKQESAVRAFAIALVSLLNDPGFEELITALIKSSAPTISEEQLKVFIAAMKVSLLTNALVALYIVMLRKMNGQFRAEELLQMILGPSVDDRVDLSDLQKGLIKNIRIELSKLPAQNVQAFISNLLSGYNQDTDINALIDPSMQVLNLFDPTISQDLASNTKG